MLLLFDVDGTLCESGEKITDDVVELLHKLQAKYTLGIVGGGTYEKIDWQFSGQLFSLFKYVFTESGVVNYIDGKLVHKQSIRDELGDNHITRINNHLMRYLRTVDLHVKTGNFIELRNGLIYFTPIGQNCTKEDRKIFKEMDNKYQIRKKIIRELSQFLYDMEIVAGGEIGISISPKGWNKSLVLRFLEEEKEIYFFGDKIYPGGNDYALAIREEIKEYYQVAGVAETKEILLTKASTDA